MFTAKKGLLLACLSYIGVTGGIFSIQLVAQTDVMESVRLGTVISETDVTGFDLIIDPDGSNLPDGEGTAQQGEAIFQTRCQACHGLEGSGINGANPLVGGSMNSNERPLLTVGSYWPYPTTIFDFIRRAMPADAPKSLSDSDVYQLTAYLLFLNGIVEQDFVLNRKNLAAIKMPNRDGFIDQSHIQ